MTGVVWCVAAVVVVALCGATRAAPSSEPHRHRHAHERTHIAHLQNTVDRLLLRQRTDHILLSNLQEAVLRLQESSKPLPVAPRVLEAVEGEGRVLATLGEEVGRVRRTLEDAVQVQKDREEITSLRQELNHLRSEVHLLRGGVGVGVEASHIAQQERREAVTTTWMVDNVKRLEDNVAELQQALNVSSAMHDKMEVESRLGSVSRDVAAMRGSVAGVASRAEAAMATGEAMQEELTRVAQDTHRSAGHLARLQTEVSSLRQDFNDLLTALPEGTMAGVTPPPPVAPQATSTPPGDVKKEASNQDQTEVGVAENEVGVSKSRVGVSKSRVGVSKSGVGVAMSLHARLDQRLTALEHRTDDLDFAVTRAQKQWSGADGCRCESRLAEMAETGRQLEARVEATAGGVAEVRLSSVQLLAAVEALETRLEKEVTEVKGEVAKVEWDEGQRAASHRGGEEEAREALDDAAALRTDLEALARRLDTLTLAAATATTSTLEADLEVAQCRAQHTALQLSLADVTSRLQAVEEEQDRTPPHHRGGQGTTSQDTHHRQAPKHGPRHH